MITTKADDRKRVVIPDARPGQVFDVQTNSNGSITLTPLKSPRRKGAILDGLKPLTKAEAEKAFGPNPEFDALEHHCASLPAGPPPDDE